MRYAVYAALLLLVAGGGCLPHSCARTGDPGALLAADSLSREVAQSVPTDTLRRVWRTEDVPLRFPRTALFLPEGVPGQVVVSDAEREALLFFSASGQLTRTVAPADFTTPYLLGRRADTLLVLSPRARRVHAVPLAGGGAAVARRFALALPPVDEAPLLWGTFARGALLAKTIDADGNAAITRHALAGSGQRPTGSVVARQVLEGPRWHHAGPLLPWRDALASTSGYRPVVHRLPLDLQDAPEAVRLNGFDSPMLSRTRRYAEGDARQPPLLLPAAAAAGEWLFVANLRAGRLHLDVFGADGRLVRHLTSPGPVQREDVYPRALAARRQADGRYALAVAFTAPRPAVARYEWQPEAPAATAAR